MNSQDMPPQQGGTFKRIDIGHPVVLDDRFLSLHHREAQIKEIVERTMENAEKQVQKILKDAQSKSQQILADAKEKAARIVEEEGVQKLEQARQEGYQAGLEKGLEQIAQELAERIRAADQILERAFEAERLIISHYKPQIVDLLQYILNLILTHELQTSPEQIIQLIDKATERIEYSGSARIVLNTETLQQLRELSSGTMDALANLRRLSFVADATCAPCEMYLETAESFFNISPEAQARIYIKTVESHLEPVLPEAVEGKTEPMQTAPSCDLPQGDHISPSELPFPTEPQDEANPSREEAEETPAVCIVAECQAKPQG